MRLAEEVTPSVREILWKLPELLEGPEPVLERPHVRRFLQADPEARSAVLAVAELARSLERGSEWIRRLPPARVRMLQRPVETARRYFARELASLLFDQGLAWFNKGTVGGKEMCASHALELEIRSPAALRATVQQLASSLDLSGMTGEEVADALLRIGEEDPLVVAGRHMTTCREVEPHWEGVWYYSLEIPQLRGQSRTANDWLSLAARMTNAGLRAECHIQTCRMLLRAGSSFEALAHAEYAFALNPEELWHVYYFAYAAACAGDESAFLAAVSRLGEITAVDVSKSSELARLFSMHAETWRDAERSFPCWDAALQLLPSPLSENIGGDRR